MYRSDDTKVEFVQKICSNRFTSVLMKYSFEVLISVTSLKSYFLINYLILFYRRCIFYFFLINTKNEIMIKNSTQAMFTYSPFEKFIIPL